jgi:hypothetical protein
MTEPEEPRSAADSQEAGGASKDGRRKSISMHDGVEVWQDCCSCEAEPYWLEAFADAETGSTGD